MRTIPWNRSGRFIVALQTDFQDRMSAPGQAADIVLLDTRNNYAPRVVEQRGGWFLGINYGRLARLRPVTGYPGARDWTVGVKHPTDDGIFKVNPVTKEKRLAVSFRQLADALRATHPEVDSRELFINHTLWSRDDSRIFFFVRGDFETRALRLDVPFTMQADGTGVRPLITHIGGHPDWESGHRLIGIRGKDQMLFDVERQEFAGTLGTQQSKL